MRKLRNRLPKWVTVADGATPYLASLPASVSLLARDLRNFPREYAPQLAAGLCATGVMQGSRLHRFAVKLVMWRHRCSEYEAWTRVFSQNETGRQVATVIIMSAARHSDRGRDTEDADSVGGFSQRETNFIGGLMHTILQVTKERELVR